MDSSIAIIRNRYQITLPVKLRKFLDWLKPNNIIKITLANKEKVILEPYKKMASVDWNKTWATFELTQNQGKKFDSTKFLVKDRESH